MVSQHQANRQAWNLRTTLLTWLLQLEDYTSFKDRLAYSLSRSALVLDNLRTSSLRENLTGQSEPSLQLLRKISKDRKRTLGFSYILTSNVLLPVDLNDNRDYSILPDHQPSKQEPVTKQTQVASPIDVSEHEQVAPMMSLLTLALTESLDAETCRTLSCFS